MIRFNGSVGRNLQSTPAHVIGSNSRIVPPPQKECHTHFHGESCFRLAIREPVIPPMYSFSDAESQAFLKFAQFPSWCGSRVDDNEALALCGMVFDKRPKVVVEVGVNTGCSTAIIAWAMREVHGADVGNTQFHAFDLRECATAAQGRQVRIGEAVREMDSALENNISFHPSETALDAHNHCKPDSIDFAFIDAGHNHPWPTLDLIALLPMIRPGAWIGLHDLIFSELLQYNRSGQMRGPATLFEAWKGEKIDGASLVPKTANIGFIRIPEDKNAAFDWCIAALQEAWDCTIPWEVLKKLKIRPHHAGMQNAYTLSMMETLMSRIGNLDRRVKDLRKNVDELPAKISLLTRFSRAVRDTSRKLRGNK